MLITRETKLAKPNTFKIMGNFYKPNELWAEENSGML